jgi:type II secretory pathway component PulF
MAERDQAYAYIAIARDGGRVRGRLEADNEVLAFEHLRAEGLSPISIRKASERSAAQKTAVGLSDRQAAQFFSSLATLLSAGADIRSALSLLATRATSKAAARLATALLTDISGGAKVDGVLAKHLPVRQAFISALLSAAEASGDLGAGFRRAADMLAARCKLRDQLISTLSYPAFVLFSTVCAMLMILLFVVPTLAPLVQQAGGHPSASLGLLLAASGFLTAHIGLLIAGTVGMLITVVALQLAGLLARPIDAFLLDGPARKIRAALVYGTFSVTLGNMLAAGAPLADALKLAIRTAPSPIARARMDSLIPRVRQGESLSAALEQVAHFPISIARLCAIGESSGSMGPMLVQAGRLEEESAMKQIELAGRLIGPAVIVILGAMVGLLMATLLSGVTQIGDGALQ